MTENEALEKHKEDCKKCWDKACEHNIQCLQKKDIEVYEELQKYRAIGTVEDLKSMKENGAFTGVELASIACMQMKLKDYQSIGTIDEFKALKEKSVAKKPIRDKQFSSLFECPTCGRRQKIMYELYHCKECGQKLDWSE